MDGEDEVQRTESARLEAIELAQQDAWADEKDEGLNRAGSLCTRVLRTLRLERCFERPVKGPKKGEALRVTQLQVPLTNAFLRAQRRGRDDGAAGEVWRKPRRNNSVRTSKYSVWTFVPLSATFQFRRFVNAFFLAVVILLVVGNTWPSLFLTPWEAAGTATYLAILVVAGMVVEGLDDLAKHRGDRAENSREVQRVRPGDGKLVPSRWGELLPGDMVVVRERETFPADLVLLYATANDKRNMCYIETSGIDGETNLKIKEVPQELSKATARSMGRKSAVVAPAGVQGPADGATAQEDNSIQQRGSQAELEHASRSLSQIVRGMFEYEQPNAFLQFNGAFEPSRRSQEAGGPGAKLPLEFRHLVLRGSELRNTHWVIGLVAYAGHETKLALSRKASPDKFSRLDVNVNRLLILLFLFYLVICGLAVGLLYNEPDTSAWWYFQNTSSTAGYVLPGGLAFLITFVVLFSNFIPISTVFLMEVINLMMSFYINHDLAMYHPETDTPARCRSAALAAEVGQVTHFFSDKTGTLTRNEMKLVGCYVNKRMHGFVPPEVDEKDPQAGAMAVADESAKLLHDTDEGGAEAVCPEDGTGKKAAAPPPTRALELDAARTLLRSGEGGSSVARKELLDLVVFLAVCHTVILDENPDTGERSLNAESPDEEAFVQGAAELGVELVDARDGRVRIRLPDGREETYTVLALNQFNSTRKRMSLVVSREDGRLEVLMKGADNVMLERAAPGQEALVDDMKRRLLQYAWGGLRTLVMGRREIQEAEFLEWERLHKKAMVAPSAEREAALSAAAEAVERDVQIIGATAVEDQLQSGVPEAIQTLRDAGIQVWVLTGDKIETAINIGLSSRLLERQMLQLQLVSTDAAKLKAQLDRIAVLLRMAARAHLSPGAGTAEGSSGGDLEAGLEPPPPSAEAQLNPEVERAARLGEVRADCLAMIVSGGALEQLLTEQKGSAELQRKFLEVARACKVVLACRVSPKQKALVVEMVRFAPDRSKLAREPITLSIGDGANDVPMIQSAHVGIGISGHEGRQAVNSSDFSIAQFRFVVRLLLVHGRWNYRRLSIVITFLVYCWALYIFVMYLFQPLCLWSGQQVYFEYLYTFFAAAYFNFAIIAVGWFNKDLSSEFVLANPWTYAIGAHNMDLSVWRMLQSFCKALLHTGLVYAVVIYGAQAAEPQAVVGSTAFATVFMLIFYAQLTAANAFTNVTTLAFAFIMLCFLVGMAIFTVPPFLYSAEAHAGRAWAQVFVVLFMAVVSDMALDLVQKQFFAKPLDVLIEQDRGFGRSDRGHTSREDALTVMREAARLLIAPVPITLNLMRQTMQRAQQQESGGSGQTSNDGSPDGALEPVRPPEPHFDFTEGQSEDNDDDDDDDDDLTSQASESDVDGPSPAQRSLMRRRSSARGRFHMSPFVGTGDPRPSL